MTLTRWSRTWRKDEGYELRERIHEDETGIGRFAGLYLFQNGEEIGGPYPSMRKAEDVLLHMTARGADLQLQLAR
ncbi:MULTISPECIES: hypothetical protein [Silvimonas]|uniref:Uncharacterized protein n=2 Tax=Silvimonas TaxID=300264 RepID=A0ABQ2P4E3_9NEIS|nr:MULTISPECIES: hypothetical protein [Silvimonas]GGP17906.1 hypothetical protein GCM10010970_02150 [Silvimonas iriomotensis]GGP24980.1 hypothetical protein GCM10010971_07990 [Silvimonas amylolytica]